MFMLKEITTIVLLQVSVGYGSVFDFSDMDSVHDEMMKFYGGTKRTVNILKPKLLAAPPAPRPPPRKTTGSGASFKLKRRKGARPGSGRVYAPLRRSGAAGAYGPLSPGSAATGGSVGLLRPSSLSTGSADGLGVGGGAGGASSGGGFFVDADGSTGFRASKTKLTFIKQAKTYNPRKAPSNKFLEALNAIARGVADAQAAEKWMNDTQNVQEKANATTDVLALAVENRMFQYARNKLGRILYRIKHSATRRPRRSTQTNRSTDASTFMSDLKKKMGSEKFDEFMAVMGDVTLMFAIDVSGSMSDDIDTAKKIAVDVINYPRQNPVSYILSPFNDPETGPVTYKNNSAGAIFVQEISKLYAHGGGDCPELTMKGILNALNGGPDWGSPLYVFTDASAKDGSQENIEEVKQMARLQGNTINFFTTGTCGDPNYWVFQEIADSTSGQVLPLSNSQELQQLTGFTGSVLGGSNVINSASNANSNQRRRRSLPPRHFLRRVLRKRKPISPKRTKVLVNDSKHVLPKKDYRYSFDVDDSMEKMSVCITTANANQGSNITLTNPVGAKITSNKTSLSRISIYEIERPQVGTWSLTIPSGCGTHNYFVKSTSDTNIDFEHYFMQPLPGPITNVPISQPLIALQTKLIITIAGYHKVQKDTVTLDLITKYGEHITNVTLSPDNRGMRYVATMTPPSRPFKIKIKGTTKAGNSFERISRNVIEPKDVMLRVLHSDKDFTLQRGQQTSVTFHIFNSNARKTMKLSARDSFGYAAPVKKSTLIVGKGKWTSSKVVFDVPSNAEIGASNTAIVSLSYNSGTGLVMSPVQLLVVE